VALMTCGFSTLDNAVTLVHSSGETDIGQWPRALLALSGLAAGFVFDWKRVHGADHVLRDDALHHRPVTAAGWPFGMGLLLAGAMGTAEVTLHKQRKGQRQ